MAGGTAELLASVPLKPKAIMAMPISMGMLLFMGVAALLVLSCSPAAHRRMADDAAARIIQRSQTDALGRVEPLDIERPEETLRKKILLSQGLPYSGPASLGARHLPAVDHWPEATPSASLDAAAGTESAAVPQDPITLSLVDALQVAAANNRQYLSKKEDIFLAALDLDLEQNAFRSSFAGTLASVLSGDASADPDVVGLENNATASITRQLKRGGTLTAQIFLDLVKLLASGSATSLGVLFDASISIPLLVGAGEHIVTEPLKQAERDVVYAIYDFERYKRILAVQIADAYLGVLNQRDQFKNAEANFKRLSLAVKRARRLADAGRLPEIQVDQAVQDELRARERLNGARQSYEQQRDAFKLDLGLPTDARIALNPDELDRLAAKALQQASPPEPMPQADKIPFDPKGRPRAGRTPPAKLDAAAAVETALEKRLDLLTLQNRVIDAQRQVVVAADALRIGITFEGSYQAGESRSVSSADQANAQLRFDEGQYTAGLSFDLPWERTAQRNAYRTSLVSLERAVRNAQALEDQVKLEVRDALRRLNRARESFKIQREAVALAQKRVRSTELFLQAGRAQIRDQLEAQEALLSAQNAYTTALVSYQIAELDLMRDMGILTIDPNGLWHE